MCTVSWAQNLKILLVLRCATACLLCDSSDEVPKAAKLPKEHKTPKAPKEPKERRRVISAADEEAECAQRACGLSGGGGGTAAPVESKLAARLIELLETR